MNEQTKHQKIIPHIWFENQGSEAAVWYTGIFEDSRIISESSLGNTPSGEVTIVNLILTGQEFQFLSAGPFGEINPSFSYMVACKTTDEVNRLWSLLSPESEVLMSLDTYPFSERYGWLKDRFGVSWQIMHDGGMDVQRITPCLLFVGEACGKAEEAMKLYTELFAESNVFEEQVSRYGPGQEPDVEGTLNYARFCLEGMQFVVMDSAQDHRFAFNEMQSILVTCESQEEIDRYWAALSAVPASEQCGWLKDKFGVSWQIVPKLLGELMASGTPSQCESMTKAFLGMKKFDIAALLNAYEIG